MALPPSPSSRIRGSVYGLACADALGGPVEFHRRGTFPTVTTMLKNDNFGLPPGHWTDDTSMTLCLAQSLVEKGSYDITDQVRKYVDWLKHGYMSSTPGRAFDIGNATRVALNMWGEQLKTDNSATEGEGQKKIDQSLNKDVRCGNGSLMRTAPIGLVFFGENEGIVDIYTSKAGSVTHPHSLCVEACQVYVRMICTMMNANGEQPSRSRLFDVLKSFDSKTLKSKSKILSLSSLNELGSLPDSEISSSGFVVHTLEAALWAFFSTNSFRDGAIKVVNLGDDADTVGAVFGALAGTYYGIDEVPKEWIENLVAKGTIDEVAEGLVTMVTKGC